MKLLKAEISNYKSLKKVEVEFSNFTVLIGQNSSGKSNFMEALYLFFNEFDPAPNRVVKGISEEIWTDKVTDYPIEIAITLKLTKTQLEKIFKDVKDFINIKFGERRLTVCREIAFNTPNTATWRTSYVALNDVPIIEDGKLVNITSSGKKEYYEDVKVAIVTEKKSKKEGNNQEPSLIMTVSEILEIFFANLSQLFKEKFGLIPPCRTNIGGLPELGERKSNLPITFEREIVASLDSEKISDTRMWDKIEKDLDVIPSLRRLYVRSGTLRSREGILRIPISHVGGGDQELLVLSFISMERNAPILAIEEPETHLHPYLSRRLFNILNKLSQKKQIIVSTHSPIFMDLVDLNNSWIFRKEGRDTKVFRIEDSEDLQKVSYELGLRPSDVFFADRVLFVEGQIDKVVYGIWAEKLQIDLKSPLITVIKLGGKTEGKRHLEAWVKVTNNIPVSVSMILDLDAKKEANALVRKKLISRRQISVLRKGAIEDYYDPTIMFEVMKERYGEEFTKAELTPSQSEGLMKFLKKKHKNWRDRSRAKSEIGKAVATKMTKEQIDDEIIEALKKTAEYLELQ